MTAPTRDPAPGPPQQAAAEGFDDRIYPLLDRGSFQEEMAEGGDMARLGRGTVDGRPVILVGQDLRGRHGGAVGVVAKYLRAYDLAEADGLPVLHLFDGPSPQGVDVAKVFADAGGVGRIYQRQAALRGKVLQVAGVYGLLFAARSFPVALADDSVWLPGAAVSLCPPALVEQLIGERTSLADLGGAARHARETGMASSIVRDGASIAAWIRRYLSYWPIAGRRLRRPPTPPAVVDENWLRTVPASESKAFPIQQVLSRLLDGNSIMELRRFHAAEVKTCLARLEGRALGVVANDSSWLGGVLFPDSCHKVADFIERCNQHGIPLLFLVDTPGFMVGREAEHQGIVRAAARLYQALSGLTVPRATVLVRRAYSAGLYAMCGPAFDPDAMLALPTARLAVFGPTLQKRIEAMAGEAPDTAVEPSSIAEVIETPAELRARLGQALFP